MAGMSGCHFLTKWYIYKEKKNTCDFLRIPRHQIAAMGWKSYCKLVSLQIMSPDSCVLFLLMHVFAALSLPTCYQLSSPLHPTCLFYSSHTYTFSLTPLP